MATGDVLKLQETLQKSATYLQEHGIESGRREAEWIFCESLGLSRMDLYTQFDMPLDAEQAALLRQLIVRRGKREPLAYVLGNQDFCGLHLAVSPAVLVPRPETEELVSKIIAVHGKERLDFLDIGTGSGAIALACKSTCPAWQVSASDVSAEALQVARQNAQDLQLEVHFHEGSLAAAVDQRYDVIVANLPYIAESERAVCDPEIDFEPSLALFAADDGLALIKQLICDLPKLAKPGASLWLEYGYKQAAAITQWAEAQHCSCVVFQDLNGLDRMARIQVLG